MDLGLFGGLGWVAFGSEEVLKKCVLLGVCDVGVPRHSGGDGVPILVREIIGQGMGVAFTAVAEVNPEANVEVFDRTPRSFCEVFVGYSDVAYYVLLFLYFDWAFLKDGTGGKEQ